MTEDVQFPDFAHRCYAHRMGRFFESILFQATIVACGIVLIGYVWPLRLLYANPLVRADVQDALTGSAERYGWILSDVSLKSVGTGAILVTHRRHWRGDDPEKCFMIDLHTYDLTPCASS